MRITAVRSGSLRYINSGRLSTIDHSILTILQFKGWGNENEQIAFLKKAIPFLDNNDCIERYSYFGINNSNKDLIKGNGPDMSNLGLWYGYKIPIQNWP